MGGTDRIILLQSAEETHALGFKMAEVLLPGTILALQGSLGAGKTSLIQGVARGLGISDFIQSPTFQYLNIYSGTIPLYHFDLYRMACAEDFFSMGFEEYFTMGGIVAIEWAERLGALALPEPVMRLYLSYEGSGRKLRIIFPIEKIRDFRWKGYA